MLIAFRWVTTLDQIRSQTREATADVGDLGKIRADEARLETMTMAGKKTNAYELPTKLAVLEARSCCDRSSM